MRYVLIIGAKSDIAKELARVYSQNGYNLYLAARDSESLKSISFDIKLRSGVDLQTKELDITNFESHNEFYTNLDPKPIVVVYVSGYMSDQKKCEIDWSKTFNTIQVNYTGAVSFLNIVSAIWNKRKMDLLLGLVQLLVKGGEKLIIFMGHLKRLLAPI